VRRNERLRVAEVARLARGPRRHAAKERAARDGRGLVTLPPSRSRERRRGASPNALEREHHETGSHKWQPSRGRFPSMLKLVSAT
jgi:hypothetical protein